MTVPKKETLAQRFEAAASIYGGALNPPDAIEEVIGWLRQKHEEMRIPTVSTMDCEMAGLVDEIFEELLADLEASEK